MKKKKNTTSKKSKRQKRRPIRELREPYRYISILSDYGFKKTFGNRANTLFLKKALQVLIQSRSPIVRLKFTRNEHSGVSIDGRGAVFDIVCEDAAGTVYIIEMQLREVDHFLQRLKYYSLHTIDIMVKKGKYSFDDLKPIYVISFLAENAFPNENHYYHVVRLKNQYGEVMDEQTTYIIVELNKWKMKVEDITTDLDKLIFFMKATETVTKKQNFSPPPFFQEDWLQVAIKELDLIRMNPIKANNYRAEMVRMAELQRIYEKDKAAIKQAEKEKAEKEKALILQKERERAEKEKALALQEEREQAEREKELALQEEREQAEKEKALALQEEREQAEKEKALALQEEREQAEREKELALQKEQERAEKENIKAIQNLLQIDVLTLEQIAQTMNCSIEKVREIQATLKAKKKIDDKDSKS